MKMFVRDEDIERIVDAMKSYTPVDFPAIELVDVDVGEELALMACNVHIDSSKITNDQGEVWKYDSWQCTFGLCEYTVMRLLDNDGRPLIHISNGADDDMIPRRDARCGE